LFPWLTQYWNMTGEGKISIPKVNLHNWMVSIERTLTM
jgi:hypothetical protein